MSDEFGLSGGEGGTDAGAGQEVVYELETEAAEPGQQAAPAAAPATPPDYESRFIALERELAAARGELVPLVGHLRAQQRLVADRPPFTEQQLDTDPNIKPSDLFRALKWEAERAAQQTLTQAQYVAKATLSEQAARGEYSAAAVGEGNDYDTLVNRYVAPLVSENPAVDLLIQQVFPNDPAGGRMLVATLIADVERNDGSIVKAIKNRLAGAAAYQQGARETTAALSRAAQAQAARVLPARAANAGQTRKLNEADIWKMPAREFDRMYAQMGQTPPA